MVTRHDLRILISGTPILAQTATLDIAAQTNPRRMLQASPDWAHTGPASNTLQIQGYFDSNWAAIFNNYTGEVSGVDIYAGSALLQNCYLQQFEIQSESHGVVKTAATFVSWNAASGNFGSNSGATHQADIVHALQASYNQTGIVYPYSFSYQVQSERVPRFLAGQTSPDKVRLGRLEKEITIQGRNVPYFIDHTAGTGIVDFQLSGYSMFVSGEISEQNFSLGDMLQVGITIKQFLR